MKNVLKGIGIFVGGLAIGVGGSYKYFETKFSKIADAEIESIKMMARRNSRLSGVDVDGKKIELENVPCGSGAEYDGDPVIEQQHAISDEEPERPQFTAAEMREAHRSYNEISAAYKTKVAESMSKEPPRNVNYNKMSREETDNIDNSDIIAKLEPIVISAESFVEDCQDYDKLTLNYYAVDKVLLDDNGDVFEDYEDYVGHDSLNQFGAFGVGDNLVYVRSDKWESDYEIIKFEESYI